MNGYQTILKFFNSKVSNKIFTRAEYFTAMKSVKIKDSYKDTVRCYLVRAGYLKDIEPGVYRKLKKIPEGLSMDQLLHEAYYDARVRRLEEKRLRFHKTPYGVRP